MTHRDLLAIGTSAGGVDALLHLARRFKPDFPAAIFITIHLSSAFRSSLDDLISRAGPLPATFADDGEIFKKGRIYLAPPDRHLLIAEDRLQLGVGPRENNSRPAIDPMMRSIALCCGPRAVAAVLTGTLDDGASGLWAIGRCGGLSVVQDPNDAAFGDMPLSALNKSKPDHVAPLAELPELLDRLVRSDAGPSRPVPPNLTTEVEIARGGHFGMSDMDRLGRRSVFACPDCHGVMWEIDEDHLVRFRCHVGHAYVAEALSVAMDENLRRALSVSLRALEERVALAFRLRQDAEQNGRRHAAATWALRASELERELDVVRRAIARLTAISAHAAEPVEPDKRG